MPKKSLADVKLTYIYYVLLVACFINSLYFLRDPKVKVLAILLFLSIATEAFAQVNIIQKLNYYGYYHVFTIAEYGLITAILAYCVGPARLRRLMYVSIPLFGLCCVLITFYVQDVKKMPSISGGIEGTLLVIWCLRAFYDIRVDGPKSIFQQSSFWFIMAFYSYYIIVTPFNCVFNILQEDPLTQSQSTIAFTVINSPANYLLYILCMIGLYCLKQAKYTQPLS